MHNRWVTFLTDIEKTIHNICILELAEDGEQYCFQIIFHGPNNRTYVLSAESQTIMEQWMKSLTCAGYDYMKLMVGELQRQLDEIEGTKGNLICVNIILDI